MSSDTRASIAISLAIIAWLAGGVVVGLIGGHAWWAGLAYAASILTIASIMATVAHFVINWILDGDN